MIEVKKIRQFFLHDISNTGEEYASSISQGEQDQTCDTTPKKDGFSAKTIAWKAAKYLLNRMFKLVIALLVIYLFLYIHKAASIDGLYGLYD